MGANIQALECHWHSGENDSTPFTFSFQLIQNITESNNKQYVNVNDVVVDIPLPQSFQLIFSLSIQNIIEE